ncbi:308_t:CDS:2, partial [Racocetra persica]
MVKRSTIIKTSNILAYFLFLSVSILWEFSVNQEKSPYTPAVINTYIGPVFFTYFIWVIIHLFLAGFVIYQVFELRDDLLDNGIQWYFVAVTLLNTLWLTLWHIDLIIISWLAIIVAAVLISAIYWNLKEKFRPKDKYELLFIHIPFSLYHAWIFVLTIITTFTLFTPKPNINDKGPTMVVLVFVIIGLILMEVIAIVYIERFKDVAGAAIIAWTLFGIAVEQTNILSHWIALALMVV